MSFIGRAVVCLYCAWIFPILGFFQTLDIHVLKYWFALGLLVDVSRLYLSPTKLKDVYFLKRISALTIAIYSVPGFFILGIVLDFSALTPHVFLGSSFIKYLARNSVVFPITTHTFDPISCRGENIYAYYLFLRIYEALVFVACIVYAMHREMPEKLPKRIYADKNERPSPIFIFMMICMIFMSPVFTQNTDAVTFVCDRGVYPIFANTFNYLVMSVSFIITALGIYFIRAELIMKFNREM